MLGVKIEDLKIIWNSQAIMTPAEKFQNRLLFQFGAYCRTVQKNSIKQASNKRAVSQAGEPPVFHPGSLMGGKGYRDTIFYAVDTRTKQVSIGPILLNKVAGIGGDPTPSVLEKGGTTFLVIGRSAKVKRRHISGSLSVRPLDIRARPSAQPAFEKTVKKQLPRLIAGGIMREL